MWQCWASLKLLSTVVSFPDIGVKSWYISSRETITTPLLNDMLIELLNSHVDCEFVILCWARIASEKNNHMPKSTEIRLIIWIRFVERRISSNSSLSTKKLIKWNSWWKLMLLIISEVITRYTFIIEQKTSLEKNRWKKADRRKTKRKKQHFSDKTLWLSKNTNES